MSARAVLDAARAAGFKVESRGDKLHVVPTPPSELVEQLRQHKLAIVEILTPEPSRGPCIWCGQPVTRLGPNQGFRNAYLELVHLRCPS